MPKMPWVKWYHQDWIADPCLTVCSPSTRGIWMDALARMKLNDTPSITGSIRELAMLCRCDISDMELAITELEKTNTAAIFKQNESITITCRRLRKEHDISELRAEAGRKGGSKTKAKDKQNDKANQKQTSVSASASASNTLSKKGDCKGDRESDFERCWSEYPNKQGKPLARKAFLKSGVDADYVIEKIRAYIECVKSQRDEGFKELKFAHGGTWFHQERWEDEYEITETIGSTESYAGKWGDIEQ